MIVVVMLSQLALIRTYNSYYYYTTYNIYISSRDLLVLSFSVIGYNRIVSFVYFSFVVDL
jgi:hypothetical protein